MPHGPNILIFGAGRMGLSHAAMARLLSPTASVDIFDPDFKSRAIVGIISGKKIRCISKVEAFNCYSHVIIASPPRFHDSNYSDIFKDGYAGKVLVEKPVMLESQDHSALFQSGYVLRHNKYVRQMIADVSSQRVKEIDINLTTNQDFSCDNSSWRMQENFPGQSMLNEFGSHCINIALAFSGDLGFIALSSESNKVCMQSAVAGDHIANIQLYGGARDVRKSVFTIAVTTEDFVYETDLYSFQKRLIDGELVEKVSLATQGISAAAYLRGIDFSEQMTSFLSGKYENSDIIDSRRTDRIISEIQGSLTNA